MHRAPRVILTVCLATLFFGGRYALVQEGPRTTEAALYALVNLAGQLPNIPVAGADLEELTGKARVCLSMLNTFLRRYKKRPITSAVAPSAVPNSAHIRSRFETLFAGEAGHCTAGQEDRFIEHASLDVLAAKCTYQIFSLRR